MIGQMNCLVQVQSVAVSQNDDGDIIATPSTVWNKWANVEQNSGNLGINNGMSNFTESYRLEMWYEPSRPTQPNYIITFDGKSMKVISVNVDNQGNRKVERIIADTSN